MDNANLFFWGTDQADEYLSIHSVKNIEDAFNDALRGITDFDNIDKFSNEVVFSIKEEGNCKVYYDGNSDIVPLEEVEKRRKN